MKIDLRTAALYTDSGQYLKTLHCPLQQSWEAMAPAAPGSRQCHACSRPVHDTSILRDDELQTLLVRDPGACLMVSPTQANCTVIPLL